MATETRPGMSGLEDLQLGNKHKLRHPHLEGRHEPTSSSETAPLVDADGKMSKALLERVFYELGTKAIPIGFLLALLYGITHGFH